MRALGADSHKALRLGPEVMLAGTEGPLAGRSFVAKDVFDVAGFATGAGHPEWLAEAGTAQSTAAAVAALVDAGATLIGKAHTDELAYSLSGTNVHYGTPVNPAAPGRMPGGSSSGSAVAVASGLCDIGLGGDTGGSVRVPASYCGIWGIRPSHGRVASEGMVPLAPSFDTVGWFARDANLLALVGQVLLEGWSDQPGEMRRLVVAEDAWAIADTGVREANYQRLEALASQLGMAVSHLPIAGDGGLERWAELFTVIQGREAWAQHGAWVSRSDRRMGPGVTERFRKASEVSAEAAEAGGVERRRITAHLSGLLGDGSVLVLPAASSPAPELGLSDASKSQIRRNTLRLTCAAGLAGLPSVSCPLLRVDGAPVGVCFVGSRGTDEGLLRLAQSLS